VNVSTGIPPSRGMLFKLSAIFKTSASCTNATRFIRRSLKENDYAYYRFDTYGTGSGSRNDKKGAGARTRGVSWLEASPKVDVPRPTLITCGLDSWTTGRNHKQGFF